MAGNSLQMILWACAGGVSLGCLAYLFMASWQASREQARRFRATGRSAASPLFKVLRPVGRGLGFFLGRISAQVEIALGRPAEKSFLLPARIWAEKRLRAAAHPQGVTADELLGMVILGGILGGLMGLAVNLRLHFDLVILAFIGGGMYFPLLWLRGQVHRRQDEVRRQLPYALDLLTISVEAGLDFTQALARIVKKLGAGALALELGRTLQDIQLGRTRAEAMRALGRRVDLSELNSLISALIQADQLGSGLSSILHIQSAQLRIRRSQRAEKLAMEAPVKILLPLILFIFPTIFIMIFGPIALRLLR